MVLDVLESEQPVGSQSCAVWTAGWKAGTEVGLCPKTCFSSLLTVTNVPVVLVSVGVVVRWSRNVGEHQTHHHLEFACKKTALSYFVRFRGKQPLKHPDFGKSGGRLLARVFQNLNLGGALINKIFFAFLP